MPRLRFNTKIYKKKAVSQAAAAYSSLAKFKIKENKDYVEVEIGNVGAKFKDSLVDEFRNYVLGMTKKCF